MAAMRTLARLSWLVPCVALAALGLLERAGAQPPAGLVLGLLLLAVVFGALIALVVRRRGDEPARQQALLGLGANAAVALILGLAALAGVRARSQTEAQMARIRQSVLEQMVAGGWSGAIQVGNARFLAAEMNRGELKEVLSRTFRQPFTLVLMAVDNRQGQHDMVLDLSHVKVLYNDGRQDPGIDRATIMASTERTDEDVRKHAAPYRVAKGQRFENALAFLPPGTDLKNVAGLEIRVNGGAVMMPGRWLSAADKQAMKRGR
jgi:hypothetical protein